MAISIIAGLGNPGKEYEESRHNLGFQIIDQFAKILEWPWEASKKFNAYIAKGNYKSNDIKLIKPQLYMNNSGQVLANICRYFEVQPENLVVIYDDINLDLGRLKVSIGGGSGGHNGVADVISHIDNNFIQFRAGIGAKAIKEMALKDYVLAGFSVEEKMVLTNRIPEHIKYLQFLIEKGAVEAMNLINQKSNNNEQKEQQTQL